MLKYKGYEGVIDDIDAETGCLSGSVIGIQGAITFEGATAAEAVKAFRESVDDYLDFCADLKQEPEKPFSGKFVVRISPDLHQRASETARKADVSLNGWMVGAVEQHLKKSAAPPPKGTRFKTKARRDRKKGKDSKQRVLPRA
jgi:predicted HicB family RNase H-like nuclease